VLDAVIPAAAQIQALPDTFRTSPAAQPPDVTFPIL